MNDLRKKFKPVEFFTMDFVLTWVPLWLAVLSIRNKWISFNFGFMVIAAISATLAAIVMIYSSKDKLLIKDYWNRVFNIKRIKGKWWAITLLLIPLINSIAIVLSTFWGKSLQQFQFSEKFLANPLIFLVLILAYGPIPEELGWRGYGIDSLRTRFNLFVSSIILAIIWIVWHIPFFFLEGSYQNHLSSYLPGLIAFNAALIPTEIITDWIFYKNNRSTLTAILFHFSINFSGEILKFDMLTKVIQAALLFVFAAIIVLTDKRFFFSKDFEIDFSIIANKEKQRNVKSC